MCMSLTPVLCIFIHVIIEVSLQHFPESVGWLELGKSTSLAEIFTKQSNLKAINNGPNKRNQYQTCPTSLKI